MTDSPEAAVPRRPLVLAGWLVIAGLIGLWAAFELLIDKIDVLKDPNFVPSCNINILVGCSANLNSWQGSLFGFPNPVLGLGGWTATVAMGAILFAARGPIARWFWLLFNLGVAGALALVVFLIYTSVFSIFSLCPWCMLTWTVTIPTFWAVTFYNLKSGNIPLPPAGRRVFEVAYTWTPLITLLSYIVVAVIAQVQLDWLHRAFA